MENLADETNHKKIPATGLTVLVEPDAPLLDVIFIHGFTGHPEGTWTHERGNVEERIETDHDIEFAEHANKLRKIIHLPFRGSRQEKSKQALPKYWPRDLLPDTLPFARVMTYGYDTHIRHGFGPLPSSNSVFDIAGDCLVALEAQRRKQPSRPLIFIVHSLGGIVVKEILRRLGGGHCQPHFHGIFESTIGIIFFGTPHRGADPRGFLQHVAEHAIRLAGFKYNKTIVETLLPGGDRLRQLMDEFHQIADGQNWTIHSFQEHIGVKYVKNGSKIVEDSSSCLGIPRLEVTEHIVSNHMEMCRFTGPDDTEYKKVAAALHRLTERIIKTIDSPKASNYNGVGFSHIPEVHALDNEQIKSLVESLKFDQIDSRQRTIRSAHVKTCKWLLGSPEYLDWLNKDKLDEHHGFLWIKGKPGTGKSTIMKFARYKPQQIMKNRTLISFFFNARGAISERSTIGMYRSLLLQLLEKQPNLQTVFELVGFSKWNYNEKYQWSIETLKDLFEQAIMGLGQRRVVCFIDALDECDDDQVRDMISYFHRLGEVSIEHNVQFHVCFSSRPYPAITVSKGVSLELDLQHGHGQDIVEYIDSELKIGHSKVAKSIREQLREKAKGIFMWVVLVVGILNREHDSGRIRSLEAKLQEIPDDLHKLFQDILTRDPFNRSELLLCIQWLLFAKQPLTPQQLYFAILSETGSGELMWKPDECSTDDIERFIVHSSKGLADITKSKLPTVQFIHESVRDFLLKDKGLSHLSPDLELDFQGESHNRLKRCCIHQMEIDRTLFRDTTPRELPLSEEATTLRQSANEKFPFLEYAAKNVLYHANAAEEGGISQTKFMQRFNVSKWVELNNVFEKHKVRRHTSSASLLYVLAETNMASLIKVHPDALSCFEIEAERCGTPMFAALANKCDETIQTFLKLQVEAQPPESPFHRFFEEYGIIASASKNGRFNGDFIFRRRSTVQDHMLDCDSEAVLLCFYLRKGTELEYECSQGRTALSYAARTGLLAVVKMLIEVGAELESKDDRSMTPVLYASECWHEEVVKVLLAAGVNPHCTCRGGRTSLSYAAGSPWARNEVVDVVKILLAAGVSPHAACIQGRTPLSYAAESHGGRVALESVVKLLLAADADPDSACTHGRTPLSYAAGLHGRVEEREAIVRLLLAAGADPNSACKDGRTPLSYAAESSGKWFTHGAIEKLLLAAGADPNSKDHNNRTPSWWERYSKKNGHMKELLGHTDLWAELDKPVIEECDRGI